MKHLAETLAMSIVHIATREPRDDDAEDEDVQALESVAAELANASPEEIHELSQAAMRLAKLEHDTVRRDNYRNLMSHLGLATN